MVCIGFLGLSGVGNFLIGNGFMSWAETMMGLVARGNIMNLLYDIS